MALTGLNTRKFQVTIFTIVFSMLLIISCKDQPGAGSAENKPESEAVIKDQPLDWFREAKFGMFIHWGPYSLLAGEYNGRQVPVGENSEWIMKYLQIPVKEYRQIARKFNPVKFNAKEIVQLAKAAGMKYIVITAKHHDGFAMYDSKVSEYNITGWTDFKRDPLKELSAACAEEGIKFCFYYSHREDWEHPGGYGNDWDYDNDWGSDLFDPVRFGTYLEEKAKPQVKELMTGYGPVGLVWFDRGIYTREQGEEFVELVHSLQPNTLINGRVGHYDQEVLGDYQSMSDNGMPPGGIQEYWETPMTLNETWGFSRYDTLWKSSEVVIQRLIEIVSRGGNFLLNIGPGGDGSVPEATVKILKEVGQWIDQNGEAVYGTTANPFGELPWGYCTVKGNRLYLFVRDWPGNRLLTLSGLRNQVSAAYMLSNKQASLNVTRTDNQLNLELTAGEHEKIFPVVVVETVSPPEAEPRVVGQDKDGRLEFNYLTAITHGKAKTRFNRKGGFHISKWQSPEDMAEWIFTTDKPGKFILKIKYASREPENKKYEITISSTRIEKPVVCTGDWYEFREFPAGYVDLPETGSFKLQIRPGSDCKSYLMYLHSLSLTPVKNIKEAGWGAK